MTHLADAAVPETAFDAIDARNGRPWTRSQALKNAFIWLGVRLLVALLDRVPARLLRAIGRRAGRAAARWSRQWRRVATDNAALGLPEHRRAQVARSCFEHAGENLMTSLLLRRRRVRALDWVFVDDAARGALADVLSRGRGAVFVSAHLGPYEFVAACVAELEHRPAVVVRESYDRRLDAVVDAHRLLRGVDVIHRGHKNAGFRLMRALREGRPIGILPDLGGRVPSLPTEFLGDVVGFPLGAALLAQKAGAPLVVGTLARRSPEPGDSRLFRLSIRELSTVGTVAELTQRVAHCLESAILECPEDWLWMAGRHRFIADERVSTLD